jgi:hypothetical protein
VLVAHARVNQLIALDVYDEATKVEILDQLKVLGLLRSDSSTYAMLRKIRGRFLTRRQRGETLVAAAGRASWVGWVELTTEPVSELSSRHTAMVIRDLGCAGAGCCGGRVAGVFYETDAEGEILSRDCAEYHVQTPHGHRLVILANHLKSKGCGSPGDPMGRRSAPAKPRGSRRSTGASSAPVSSTSP